MSVSQILQIHSSLQKTAPPFDSTQGAPFLEKSKKVGGKRSSEL